MPPLSRYIFSVIRNTCRGSTDSPVLNRVASKSGPARAWHTVEKQAAAQGRRLVRAAAAKFIFLRYRNAPVACLFAAERAVLEVNSVFCRRLRALLPEQGPTLCLFEAAAEIRCAQGSSRRPCVELGVLVHTFHLRERTQLIGTLIRRKGDAKLYRLTMAALEASVAEIDGAIFAEAKDAVARLPQPLRTAREITTTANGTHFGPLISVLRRGHVHVVAAELLGARGVGKAPRLKEATGVAVREAIAAWFSLPAA